MRRLRGEGGFSLLETLAAITVFGIITVGVTPLLVGSLRGSGLSRSFTVAKSLAQESMERIRGFPYFDTAAGRDVLDLYFPNLVAEGGAGYDAGSRTFTTVCTPTSSVPAASGAKACPPNPSGAAKLPPGYTLTYVAQFVVPNGATPEVFVPADVPATYNSAAAATATPPAQLLNMRITVSWTQLGRPRTFTITSLIGDRKLSPDKARGIGTVDFTVQALTSFRATSPERLSSLTAIAGRSIADVEIRSFASAMTENDAGRMTLARQEYNPTLGGEPVEGETIATARGAEATVRAPNAPTEVSVGPNQRILHPDLLNVPYGEIVDSTKVNSTGQIIPVVQVTNNLPLARGAFSYSGSNEHWWVNNQFNADTSTSKLKLDPLYHVFSVWRRPNNLIDRLRGHTYAEATAVDSADRKVEATAYTELGKAELFVSTITAASTDGDRGVVVVRDFKAQVRCKATNSLSTSIVDGAWSATLRYWRDPTNTALGDPSGSGYVDQPIGGTLASAADPLAAIRAENPLVIDDPVSDANDVYLFEIPNSDPSLPPVQRGFLESWSSTPTLSSAKTTLSDGGIEARVSMPFALNMVTSRTDGNNPETKLTISFGKLSCRAVDKR